MLIKDALIKGNNNFNLLRVFLASLVVYYHSFALFEKNGYYDPVTHYLSVVSTGGLAVKAFFFLSGMLVTNSLFKNSSPVHFLQSRAKRILPGYWFVIFISCLIIGPMLSSLKLHDYIYSPGVWDYFFNNLSFRTSYFLPGVFENSKYAFNGSIWTIPLEVKCYAVLLAISIMCRMTSNKISPLICILIIIMPLTPFRDWLFDSNNNPAVYMLAPCFSLGCIIALCREYSIPNPIFPALALISAFFINDVTLKSYMICFPFCILILYFFSSKLSLKIKMKSDPSYGMYLWAFPIQQIIANYITTNLFLGFSLSITASLIIGRLSWNYIEKPFLKNKRAL